MLKEVFAFAWHCIFSHYKSEKHRDTERKIKAHVQPPIKKLVQKTKINTTLMEIRISFDLYFSLLV